MTEGDTSWIEPTIFAIKKCLGSDQIPDTNPVCESCKYRELTKKKER